MGPRPSSLSLYMGGRGDCGGFLGAAVLHSSWTSGSHQRGDEGWGGRGRRRGRESEKEDPKKGDRWRRKNKGECRGKAIKGGEDKANWAGRSDNSFVVEP